MTTLHFTNARLIDPEAVKIGEPGDRLPIKYQADPAATAARLTDAKARHG